VIFWFTGQSGAGKTTVVRNIKNEYNRNAVILDGDEMRASISLGAGFSKEARGEHNARVARLAKVLDFQNHMVFVSVIAPFEEAREYIYEICKPIWIHVRRKGLPDNWKYPYQKLKRPGLIIDNDLLNPDQAAKVGWGFIQECVYNLSRSYEI